MRVRLSLDFEIGEFETVSANWVRTRFEQYKIREGIRQLRESLDRRAVEVSESLFDSLRVQIEKDVAQYNELFKECPCRFSRQPDGFLVERLQGFPRLSLAVRKSRKQTAIVYTVTATKGHADQPQSSEGHVTVKPNYGDGEICFEYGKKLYKDPSDVSELLLDAILCGPKDYE